VWTLTEKGRRAVEAETTDFTLETRLFAECRAALTHVEIQQMLCEIGAMLGFFAEPEFEFYDVVWRTNQKSPRLSHVFEVQRKGNIDSAFAKLKKAFDAQRSKLFLILASERDTTRALRSISLEQAGAFHELSESVTIVSFAQIEQIHRSLQAIGNLLPLFLSK